MGPLKGIKILEVGGIGPGPLCGMILADMGAEVVRVDRKGHTETLGSAKYNISLRGKYSICLDLKKPQGVAVLLQLVEKADVLMEGFRPGVMEKLGLGPKECLRRNPKLVYGRMTGWGQEGPLSQVSGHDINYISLTGALHCIGQKDRKPSPPLNLVGDYGGGAMLLAFGIVCALFETQKSGQGQIVDAAMIDGVSALMALFYGMQAAGQWSEKREDNLLDGGAHFYDTYETKDGKWISIGSIEPQFYRLLLDYTGLSKDIDFQAQSDKSKWALCKQKLADIFKSKSRKEWCEIMEGTDICFAPVLSICEAFLHPHNVSRGTYIEIDGVKQPSPAPRFSRTNPQVQKGSSKPGEDTETILLQWGVPKQEILNLKNFGVI